MLGPCVYVLVHTTGGRGRLLGRRDQSSELFEPRHKRQAGWDSPISHSPATAHGRRHLIAPPPCEKRRPLESHITHNTHTADLHAVREVSLPQSRGQSRSNAADSRAAIEAGALARVTGRLALPPALPLLPSAPLAFALLLARIFGRVALLVALSSHARRRRRWRRWRGRRGWRRRRWRRWRWRWRRR